MNPKKPTNLLQMALEKNLIDASLSGDLARVRVLVAQGQHPEDMSGVAMNCVTHFEIFRFLFQRGLFAERDVCLALFVTLDRQRPDLTGRVRALTGNDVSVGEIVETYRQYIAPILNAERISSQVEHFLGP